MPKAIEINKHKFFKLGKKEAKRDKRISSSPLS